MSNTLLQPAAFLAMLYGGAAAGLAYDVFRLARRIIHARAAGPLCDALFLICAAFIALCSFLFASGGEIRPYLCLGFLAGFMLEQWSISALFFRAVHRLGARLPPGKP